MPGRKKVKKVAAPAKKAAARQGKQAADKEHVFLHKWTTMYEEHGGFWVLRRIDLLESLQRVIEEWAWCQTFNEARDMGLERDVQRELGLAPIPFAEVCEYYTIKVWISNYKMFDGHWKLTELSTCSSVAVETWTWMKHLR